MHDDDDDDEYKDNERVSDDRGCSLRGVLLFRVCDVLLFRSEVDGALVMFRLFLSIRQVGRVPSIVHAWLIHSAAAPCLVSIWAPTAGDTAWNLLECLNGSGRKARNGASLAPLRRGSGSCDWTGRHVVRRVMRWPNADLRTFHPARRR